MLILRDAALGFAATLAGCEDDVGPPDPAGTRVTALSGGTAIDFENGEIGGAGVDLAVDSK